MAPDIRAAFVEPRNSDYKYLQMADFCMFLADLTTKKVFFIRDVNENGRIKQN